MNPTVVMTPMGQANWSDPQKAKAMLDRIPLGRFAGELAGGLCGRRGYGKAWQAASCPCALPILFIEMDNVVDAILFLLSDRSSMTTGCTLPVDGGFLAT